MALSLSDVERVCRSQFPCEVIDKGTNIHGLGHHTFEIIVGQKKNPAYSASDLALPGQRTAPQIVSDSRTIHIPGNWDEEKLLEKIKGIKNSLPENKTLPKFDRKVTGIAGNPEAMYDPELVKRARQQEAQTEQLTTQNDQIVSVLGTITNALSKLEQRLEKLESKKKIGRPPKVKVVADAPASSSGDAELTNSA